ncbi:F-box domain, FBD domain, Leucine-rich repeat domain, L domain-like protein [Artemisia annua]|uniref:F-box domain, FBD domain, Leucine-rich repeat domain, L domain-like protein n=1 Tax=Artemisia annua TaxID=35608 RepID=A0A2U1P0U4_ARTAN|nr:F-box domain, FBD domain, Leucine-rich repeat domain, L domain-like protein [Artemisia annua]
MGGSGQVVIVGVVLQVQVVGGKGGVKRDLTGKVINGGVGLVGPERVILEARGEKTFIMDDLQMSTTLAPKVQGGLLESDPNDFISRMPDDVLVMILGCLPIKEVLVTSSLSKRWRFLWCDVTRLNFDSPQKFYRDQSKNINEVNAIIKSYHPLIVQDFRIYFGLRNRHRCVIHKWLQFAVDKKVEFLELDLMDGKDEDDKDYDFPSRLFKTSPHLSGRALKLKHLEIVGFDSIYSIELSDFDLESFTYKGLSIDLRLTNLPKLKKVGLCPRGERWPYNVFDQISSCALSLPALSLDLRYRPTKCLKLDSLPELPNLKNLRLVIGGSKCNFLLDLASILNACPKLETFTLQPFWTSPITNKRKAWR